VTKALEAVDGVTSATVDFKSETAVVTGDADADALVAAVVAAGKRASIRE
jgi:copper chaperone CopZ